ncbi:MAG: hypothetical protein E6G22_11845 [Actinobacteria bacterium]|nr:MAG: hypothetical protein E6G22_11845 [Actinomycetota bacterium]
MAEEREVQHDPQVLEGDDDLPRQPASHRDPYTPEPGPRPGERRAFRLMLWALLPIAIAVLVVVWAAVR